ncbi:unnamed protein product, partial [marine sediment metagenome]
MPDDKVVRVKNDLYQKAQDLAKADGIPIAEAIAKLVEQGGAGVPSACQLNAFDAILREQGLTPPRRPDWVWGVTDVLPIQMLAGTKLEPYAKARTEAELRCAIGEELYSKLVAGELTEEEKSEVTILTETPAAEP